ncbi:MAG: hypothetical protein K5925_01440 [Bacilli bacterium]|nr:hypothetical protein [Bacilli bacterium]
MKKVNLFKLVIMALIGISSASVVAATLSWFMPKATITRTQDKLNGSTMGAYFAYGNGIPKQSEQDVVNRVYGITKPRHLYNLAWLQYLGYFEEQSGYQYYFEIGDMVDENGNPTDVLDMEGWVIPAIGTEEHPFIGNFNGNGKIIANLTVSNDFGDFSNHPATITEANYTQAHILGLFGVVGNYAHQVTPTEGTSLTYGYYTDRACTIQAIGTANGSISYWRKYDEANETGPRSYSSSINELTNTGITNITITTALDDTLIGMAAGYINGNMSNIAVDAGTFNVTTTSNENATTSYGGFTSNISDHSVVGYTTNKKNIKKVTHDLYDVNVSANHEFNASDSGDAQGWGGSINMKTIYERLYAIKAKGLVSTENSFGYKRVTTYYDGVKDDSSETDTYTSNYMQSYHGYNVSGHEYIGNYFYMNRGSSSDQWMYLSGGHYENSTYNKYYEHEGYHITDGTNYLDYRGSDLENYNGDSPNTMALPWDFVSAGGSSYYIRTNYNNATNNRYLYNSNGELKIASGTTTNSNAIWEFTESGEDDLIISNGNKKIYYYNGSWQLIPTTDQTDNYYIIKSGSNYISKNSSNNSNVSNTTSESDAARFYIEPSTNNLYFMNGGTKQYLAIYYTYTTNWRNRVESDSYAICTTNNYNQSVDQGGYYCFSVDVNNKIKSTVHVADNGSGGWFGSITFTDTVNYLYYSGGWSRTTTSGSSLTPTSKSETVQYSNYKLVNTFNDDKVKVLGPDYYPDSPSSVNKMYFDYDDTTYFPLNVEHDGKSSYVENGVTITPNLENKEGVESAIANGNFDPKDSNTGYIVAGSDYSSITGNNPSMSGSSSSDTNNRNNISKMRISSYAISNVSGSFNPANASVVLDTDFPHSNILTILPNGTLTNIGQVYGNDSTTIYSRYKKSRESFFENALTTNTVNGGTKTYSKASNIYGLHFMDTSININSVVNASKVSVLGNKCDNYQMPVHSIDFNLKQKGVINFFAGTYFTDNNSFFSLHEIIRNNDAVQKKDGSGNVIEGQYTSYNTIKEIKEIEEIFITSEEVGDKTSKYSVIYKYKGKTGNEMYSVPFRIDGNQNKFVMNMSNTNDNITPYTYSTMGTDDFNSYVTTYGYVSRFKTSQIGVNSGISSNSNKIFYYEFPMNPGEYCLGSVSGGTGAYLLYLDIGANAAKTQRTIFYEHFKYTDLTFDYPVGVAIVATSTVADNVENGTALDETNTANTVVKAGYKGAFSITRSGNSVSISRESSFTANAKPTLVGELMWDNSHQMYNIHIPLSDGDTGFESNKNLTSEITAKETHITDTRRVYYVDYNVNLDEYTKTQIIDTKVDNGAVNRTYYQEYSDGTSSTNVDNIKVYNTNGGTRYTSSELAYSESAGVDNSNVKTYDTTLGINNTMILKFKYEEPSGAEVTAELVLSYEADGTYSPKVYQKFKEYEYTVSCTGSDIVITIIDRSSGEGAKVIKINTESITKTGAGTQQSPYVITPTTISVTKTS